MKRLFLKKIAGWTEKWSFLIALLLVGTFYLAYMDIGTAADDPQEVQNVAPDSRETQDSVPPADIELSQQSSSQEADCSQEIPLPTQEPITYREPEDVVYQRVEDDYFADALFIGDSRTVGMYEYGGLSEIATFYASTGLTVYKMFDASIVTVAGEKEKKTIEEALQEKQFAKIYLMIGINEMGTGTVETFIRKYSEAVARLRELQPDAIIYLQGIMKVTTERSEKGDYIHNEGIEERNERIAGLADNVNIYYLDVNPLICDETGGMQASYTFDGVHLKAQYIGTWKEYLKEHAADIFSLTDL